MQYSHLTILPQLLYGSCRNDSALDKSPFYPGNRESNVTNKTCFLNSYYVPVSGLGAVNIKMHQAALALEDLNITGGREE